MKLIQIKQSKMNISKNTTVILPIHSLSGEVNISLFNKAIKSIYQNEKNLEDIYSPEKLLIVFDGKDKELKKFLIDYDFSSYPFTTNLVENNEKTDIASQINLGVANCDTEWFSILEFDDEYLPYWFGLFETFRKKKDNVSIFLPIVALSDMDKNLIRFENELSFAQLETIDEEGYLNLKTIESIPNFSLSGAVIKKNDFLKIGGIKTNFKLTFIYEFMIRAAHKCLKIFTIPKIGYIHRSTREDSYLYLLLKDNNSVHKISKEEFNYLMYDVALKEYFFTEEREIKTFSK
jgi:hypothetical protein